MTRCGCAEVDADDDRFVIPRDGTREGESSAGAYSLDLFGAKAATDMRGGRTLVVRDVDADLGPAGGGDMFNAIGIKAIVCCPLVKAGRLVAMMAVHSATPRDWSGPDIALVEQVVDRCWAHIERAKADQAVRAGEAHLQLAVHIARVGTCVIDLLTDAVEVNDVGRELYGWPSRHTTFAAVQAHFHPADKERVMRRVGAAFDPAGTGSFDVEQRIFRVDGAERWIRVRGRAFFEVEGAARRAVRCVGTYVDITDLKNTEEKLRESDRRKDEFLATVSHELRNPLAPVRTALEEMKRAGDDPAVFAAARGTMDRQVAHMARLVDDLLDLSRISRGKLHVKPEREDLLAVLGHAVETVHPQIEAAGHTLNVRLPSSPIPVNGDSVRLAQVFTNLLNNAAKYTDAGGVVTLPAESVGQSAVVRVADTGTGISAANLPKLFEMFSQVNSALERTQGGLGIGLALVRGVGGYARRDGRGRKSRPRRREHVYRDVAVGHGGRSRRSPRVGSGRVEGHSTIARFGGGRQRRRR